MMTAKEISQQLAAKAEEVVKHLLPNGKKIRSEWHVGSINGEPGNSLGVRLSGNKTGIWCDFENGEDKGDLLDLWSATRKIKLADAINEARHYLGLPPPHFEGYRPLNFVKPKDTMRTVKQTSNITKYLTQQRQLSNETISAFKISERGRDIVFPYYRGDELVFIKYISLDRTSNGKKIIHAESNCQPCLFGWDLINNNLRSITICEGEIDAMSLYQYGISALSVPFGGGKGEKQRWLEYEFDRLAIYDEILLCFDPDISGREAITELVERLGRHRCRIVKLPYKDPNECLQQGVTKEEMLAYFDNAQTLDPEELKKASDFIDEVLSEFYPDETAFQSYQPLWGKAQNKILFRNDEISLWTGINGHGKSQFLGNSILSFMQQGARVCIASLELKPKRLLARLTRQAGGLKEPSENYIHAICKWYEDKLWLFNLIGTAKSKRLLEVFKYARQRYGIDVFVIDSLMKLEIAEDDYKAQKSFMEELCDFKNEFNCHVHIVAHPRKGMDESRPPGKLDIKGTGTISDLADNCFTVWRNKEKESLLHIQASGRALKPEQLEKLNNADCFWCCDKQRNGDFEGRFGFWFDPDSLQYLSHSNQRPIQFVNYSTETTS